MEEEGEMGEGQEVVTKAGEELGPEGKEALVPCPSSWDFPVGRDMDLVSRVGRGPHHGHCQGTLWGPSIFCSGETPKRS